MFQIRGIKYRWLVNNLGLVIAILIIAVLVISITVSLFYYDNMAGQLITRANSSSSMLQNSSESAFYESVRQFTRGFKDKDIMEIEVIDLDRRVLYSSTSELLVGYRPGTPDVEQALTEHKTVPYNGKDSHTGERVISASSPIYLTNGKLIGAVRYVSGLRLVRQNITTISMITAACALVIFLFVVFSNYYFIRSIVNPIKQINEMTKQIAAGEYGSIIEIEFDDEIGELADSINFMSSEIERNISIKNDFISSISHELRTPLTAISGWAETLFETESNIGDLGKRGLEVIVKESSRLREMLEELLDFSRIESGRLVINRSTIDIVSELKDTIFMFEKRLAQDRLHIVYTDNVGETFISGDRSRLRQVFVNIIDNARKYSQPDGVIDITVSKSETPGYIEIVIADHGTGITPEDLPHIKEKFYKGNAGKPGSGIGLAVSDEIILLHNGEIKIDSTLGEGTNVTILLPTIKK